MSIETDSYFGIGYEIDWYEDHEKYEEFDGDLNEYLSTELSDEFSSYQTNTGYDTDVESVIVCIDEPFINGLNLLLVKESLDDELKRLNVDPESSFRVVGGLYTR